MGGCLCSEEGAPGERGRAIVREDRHLLLSTGTLSTAVTASSVTADTVTAASWQPIRPSVASRWKGGSVGHTLSSCGGISPSLIRRRTPGPTLFVSALNTSTEWVRTPMTV